MVSCLESMKGDHEAFGFAAVSVVILWFSRVLFERSCISKKSKVMGMREVALAADPSERPENPFCSVTLERTSIIPLNWSCRIGEAQEMSLVLRISNGVVMSRCMPWQYC